MKNILLILALTVCAAVHADSTATAPLGSKAVISVVVGVGTPPYTYEWYKNDVRIAGVTTQSFTIPSVSQTDAGAYRAIILNSAGQTQSDRATLVVSSIAAPVFTSDPASQTVPVGKPVTFSSAASGNPTYQWMKNGQPIIGATSPNYTIAAAATTDVGVYTVAAKNGAGSVTSKAATLTVTLAPIVTPPGSSVIQISITPAP